MKKAAVLGIGLIGGSLALCLKERTGLEVHGYDASAETLDLAKAAGVIHRGHTSLPDAVAEADVIFIAVPVGVAPELIQSLARLKLKPGCIVSDVGSTKGALVRHGRVLQSGGVTFIGGHPMAGSHQSGVTAAHARLFENAYYVLTPEPDTPLSEVQRLSRLLITATRARLVIMDPDHHDRVVGAISHLPHVVAAALVNQVAEYNRENEWFFRLAAGGFRDLTRVASSHPVMWRDILLSNRDALLPLLDDWMEGMQVIRRAVESEDASEIEAFFRRAKKFRERLPERKHGVISPSHECFVDVPDYPGEIGKVATLLGEAKVNIGNIGVMENREEAQGVLRLVFRDEEDVRKAVTCLRQAGYTVFEKD